jgi:hypothetical protein
VEHVIFHAAALKELPFVNIFALLLAAFLAATGASSLHIDSVSGGSPTVSPVGGLQPDDVGGSPTGRSDVGGSPTGSVHP